MQFSPNITKIVHQGVDTLLTSYISIDEKNYYDIYLPFLEKLETLKKEAQEKEAFDNASRFVTADLAGFGKFMVYAQGVGSFKYLINNEDIKVYLSSTKYGANDFQTAQVKVEFRSHYLFASGHLKAYEIVNKFIDKIMGKTRKLCLRLDLATDVQGIKYTGLDKFRFQTFMKNTDFEVVNGFTKNRKTTGFQFGVGDFVFRIYDKTLKIKQDPSSSYIRYKWIMNGYDIHNEEQVFRHEIQLRRAYLKKYTPNDIDDEVLWHFTQLGNIWTMGTKKIRWTDLTNSEIIRICETNIKSDSVKKIFQRARQDDTRNNFWDVIKVWDNNLADSISKYEYVKEAKKSTSFKYVKALISSTYKAYGANPLHLMEVVEQVQKQLMQNDELNLHEYGELKILSNFVQNAKIIERHSVNVINDYSYQVQDKFIALKSKLCTIDHPEMRTAEIYLEKRGLATKNAS